MDKNREKLFEHLSEISEKYEQAQVGYEKENDDWWNGLTEKEREDAFYAVVKRIHQAELIDKGSYRYTLYEIFGFGPHMYAQGMSCGFLELHNSIVTD